MHQERVCVIPPSKSHSIRAILFASMGSGRSVLKGLLNSPDIDAALHAAEVLGAKVYRSNYNNTDPTIGMDVMIDGVAGLPTLTADEIDVGNSGQVLRFFGALAALASRPILLKGDQSISSQRTIQPLVEALTQLGASARSIHGNGFAPMCVQGPICPGNITLCGRDSQPVSAMLMTMPFLLKPSTICAHNSGELPWIALTLSWLDRLNISYTQEKIGGYTIKGSARYAGFTYTPPGDFSSAAFPAVAALITGQEVTLDNLDCSDVQGDRLLFTHLRAMGASVEEIQAKRQIRIEKTAILQGICIDVNPIIDALPILAVLGCFAKGETYLMNALPARGKECDRIAVMAEALKRLGADVEEEAEGLRIRQSKLIAPPGACFSSCGDHRIAMALFVAGLRTQGAISITGTECIKKSYPTFMCDMYKMGALFEEGPQGVLNIKGLR